MTCAIIHSYPVSASLSSSEIHFHFISAFYFIIGCRAPPSVEMKK
uniref:Uncharacterized protein n=1 Tax=Anguilla anguilla TaxID=7936 RepID=A0A0E9VW79_ANGAN